MSVYRLLGFQSYLQTISNNFIKKSSGWSDHDMEIMYFEILKLSRKNQKISECISNFWLWRPITGCLVLYLLSRPFAKTLHKKILEEMVMRGQYGILKIWKFEKKWFFSNCPHMSQKGHFHQNWSMVSSVSPFWTRWKML